MPSVDLQMKNWRLWLFFVKKIVALLFATALDEQEAFILRQLQSYASLNKYIWSKFTQPAVN